MYLVKIMNHTDYYFVDSDAEITTGSSDTMVKLTGFQLELIDKQSPVVYQNLRRRYLSMEINRNLILELREVSAIEIGNPPAALPAILDSLLAEIN